MRTISQIGDSTDGEDYEELSGNTSKSKRKNVIERLNKYKDLNYSASCVLKEIGGQLLQSKEVRDKYREIKQKFIAGISNQEKKQLTELDKLIGPSWGIVVSSYQDQDGVLLSRKANDYFKINQQKIDASYDQDQDYNNLSTGEEKANFYINRQVKDEINNIYQLNKKIELHAQNQRQSVEPLFTQLVDSQKDAHLFLAQIKASKKLDKDLGKNYLYDYKFGTKKHASKSSITKKTTQKNETLEIHTLGGFSDYITDEGTYADIAIRVKSFIDKGYIDKSQLSKFFKASLKGEKYDTIILNDELRVELTGQLQTLVKLMFGVEVKRNTATLLTNAMFFDLVDAGQYKIEGIATKMPMAMKSAVSASATIDKAVKDHTEIKQTSWYDYREDFKPSKARELASMDAKILQDWLLWKLQDDIQKKVDAEIINLNMNATMKQLQDLDIGIDIGTSRNQTKINNKELLLESDGSRFKVKFKWDKDDSKFKSEMLEVREVKAKVFYDLILEWYGIKLPYLNKSDKITLKAAAEPKDLEDNQDEGNSKVLAIDEGKLAPETELSEYKQEDYILDKDNFDTVLQHEHAFVQPLGEIVAIS